MGDRLAINSHERFFILRFPGSNALHLMEFQKGFHLTGKTHTDGLRLVQFDGEFFGECRSRLAGVEFFEGGELMASAFE